MRKCDLNGIIIVDKPEDWTSHDVVAKLRGVFKEKRVGHGGMLDPMATGVLPIFVGRATRAAQFCENAVKRYSAGLLLGVSTDTQDTTGNVISEKPCTVCEAEVKAVLEKFRGEISQIPPMYSAIKVGGKKLYELARRGVEINREARRVTIYSLDAYHISGNEYRLDVTCSKGTYIRTLCSDIGDALGCGGCMSALCRTQAGVYTKKDAVTMKTILESDAPEQFLMSVDSIFRDKTPFVLDRKYIKACKNGNAFPCACSDGEYRVYAPDGEFLMLGMAKNGEMITIKSFFEV